MVDGAIQFTVDNGRGPITSLFKPENQFQFCNGDWHEIHGEQGILAFLFLGYWAYRCLKGVLDDSSTILRFNTST